jgi:hypothetical protein
MRVKAAHWTEAAHVVPVHGSFSAHTTYSAFMDHNRLMMVCLQVAEAQSLLANTTGLVVQQLQLPAKSCAVITNGQMLWVFDPREPDTATPGGPGYMP